MILKSRESPSHVTGLGFIFRLYLRLDRARILTWAASFFVIIYLSVVALDESYPTQAALDARASLMTNPAVIMMTGPASALDNYTFGAMLANELSLWTFLPAAIMSILLAVRHTRQDEESGRTEILRSLSIGRHAPLIAAFLTTATASLAVGASVAVALSAAGQEGADSLAFGGATAVTGLVFGAIALNTAQLTEHSRTATGMALGTLGLAAVVRGIGDVIEPQGSWVSWLSPIAWAQQMKLFVDLRWWPLSLSITFIALLLVGAVVLNERRDLGAGVFHSRPGPGQARAPLLNPFGLAGRMQFGPFAAWTIGLSLFAVAFGSLATELDTFLDDNPQFSEWIPVTSDDLTLSFAAVILRYLALGPLILFITTVLQLVSEERHGRVDALIVTGASRPALLGAWSAVAATWTVVMILILGSASGLGLAVASGDTAWIVRMFWASAAFIPAIVVSGAVAILIYGIGPQFSPLAWIFMTFVSIETFLGDLLKLPQWLRNLSPVNQTPLVPFDDAHAPPLLMMVGLAVTLTAIGTISFRRRNLTNM
ncbi:ABC transporter permease [Flaviflexus huanghaiensis]|uniref:ABC transporter permease n=1 Tax=Flaviflexus huanghaiensis TaxID=1111473 RepID=UPI0015FE2E09|nr:polyketide antibiotic transporter [Flaviflexus huanghaiensis]